MSYALPVLKIAIPSPLRKTFDYLALNNQENYHPGQRVAVSFGRRDVVGVITAVSDTSLLPLSQLKSITALIDEHSLIDEKLLTLYQWVSDYYQHPVGDVILGTLPKKIRDGRVGNLTKEKQILDVETSHPDFKLSSEQEKTLEYIQQAHTFQPFLLEGVTGSGKTEVYLQAILSVLERQLQALVLVPEIALTPQTVARFQARVTVPVIMLHSGLTDVQRFNSFIQATKNNPCVVIGTRSAVFAPLKNIGIIIVDEEHDASFKQQTGLRYSARDVAVMRAKIMNIPVVLGSATPALETIHNANQQKYHLLRLTKRAGNASLPTIVLHDISREKCQKGFSSALLGRMKTHLNHHHQILLFLNRRGYAPILMCQQCGWSAKCSHCDSRLTVHDHPKRLVCHHCGYQTKPERICQSCKQSELTSWGLGTEQLEETMTQLFPDKRICRIDRDTIKNFKTLKTTLETIKNNEVDIIIGTQMLVKGHHFENVTLVAVLDVDNALFATDFRAIERLGQSLIQVAGRAGRADKKGEVFVQTRHPDHPLLKKLLQENYSVFANSVLAERQQTGLPPYAHAVLLRASGKQKERVHDFLVNAKTQMAALVSAVEFLGPVPCVLEKKAGVYRAQLMLQSLHRSSLHTIINHFLSTTEKQKKVAGVQWVVDVDPIEV